MRTLVIIGGGNMGMAIARQAAMRHASDEGYRVIVGEPDEGKRAAIRAIGGPNPVDAEASAAAAVQRGGPDAVVLLAVKPQIFPAVAQELRAEGLASNRLYVSIMAGITTVRIAEMLGSSPNLRIVRAMPNLPLAYGRGAIAVCAGTGASGADVLAARAIFGGLFNDSAELDESSMDAFTAVAGSGPAYLFALAEAMERGALAVGFSREQAAWMVTQTLCGAADMLGQHAAVLKQHPGQKSPDPASAATLRDRVASKGGTTEAALEVLQERGFAAAVEAAIARARDRGRELGRQ